MEKKMQKLMKLVLALALAIAFSNSAFAQFGGAENPGIQAQADATQAKADAAAAKKQADDLQKQVDALKKGGGSASDNTWMWWLLLIPVGFAVWWFFFRNRGEEQQPVVPPAEDPNAPPAPDPNAPPAPDPNAPPAPDPNAPPAPGNPADLDPKTKAALKGALSGVVVVLGLIFAGNATAATCYNTAKPVGGASAIPGAVVNENNTIRCNTPSKFTIFDEGGSAVATGTGSVTFKPTVSGRYSIKVGKVTISPLIVGDRYLLFGVNASYDLVRNSINPTDTTARTKAQQAEVKAAAAQNIANSAGQAVVTLDSQLKAIANRTSSLEQRMTAIENRPAPRVDLSPMERRIATLEAELAAVKATANSALSTATTADTKATDALGRYEAMGLARFKTGIFKSKTIVEATEDAKK